MDRRITLGNILTVIIMLVSLTGYFAVLRESQIRIEAKVDYVSQQVSDYAVLKYRVDQMERKMGQ